MTGSGTWKDVWDKSAHSQVPDFELDRGFSPRSDEIEVLSEKELLAFIDAKESDVLLDAGCGSGANIVRLHSKVKRIIGIDFSAASIERCEKRLSGRGIENAELFTGSVAELPLEGVKVDRIICLSVLQYLSDVEVRCALMGFAEVLKPGGVVILHVKNRSSAYWQTLLAAKRLKKLLGRETLTYEVRPFRWYVKELERAGFTIIDFNAFNTATLDRMPTRVVSLLQKFELKHSDSWLFRWRFIRRHGADLKIKAALVNSAEATVGTDL